jgi:hypothetical protein
VSTRAASIKDLIARFWVCAEGCFANYTGHRTHELVNYRQVLLPTASPNPRPLDAAPVVPDYTARLRRACSVALSRKWTMP